LTFAFASPRLGDSECQIRSTIEFPNNTGRAGIKQFLFHRARKSQEGSRWRDV